MCTFNQLYCTRQVAESAEYACTHWHFQYPIIFRTSMVAWMCKRRPACWPRLVCYRMFYFLLAKNLTSSRKAIDKALAYKMTDARDFLVSVAVESIKYFKSQFFSGSQATLVWHASHWHIFNGSNLKYICLQMTFVSFQLNVPETMKLLPLYVLGMLKHVRPSRFMIGTALIHLQS